jgi:L-fuculose-phosphate aldolase
VAQHEAVAHHERQPVTLASERQVRQAIVEVYRELSRLGFNVAASGNVSVRFGSGFLITPTGCCAESLKPAHLVSTRFDGTATGKFKPSSEWAMHAEVYQRVPAANAVVHAHADHCVALSCQRAPIPAFHYMVQAFGGADIPCTGYHPFGSRELGAAAGAALEHHSACLLANHGMLARGATLRAALDFAILLEALARQYVLALSVGRPTLLTTAHMADVARRFADYGRQPRAPAKLRWQVP